MFAAAEKAADTIRKTCGEAEIALILGSGLSEVLTPDDPKILSYSSVPGFPLPTAKGHVGEWVSGTVCGKKVCLMRGRFHAYEGFSSREIVFPIRVMKLLGVSTLLITNAAGAVNTDFAPGDLMLITDHIAFGGENPLTGPNEDAFGLRFPDMTNAYSPRLRRKAKEAAKRLGIDLKEGVYIRFCGPSYETPAEIRAARVLGGDAVGMSTVPEVIAARHCGMEVLGISCLTNMAAGILDKPLSHAEVLETGKRVCDSLSALIRAVIGSL